jgi:crotonobetainyl-CoA:carnitine CoA-transferase CaiB-like acyl-CoA transferase
VGREEGAKGPLDGIRVVDLTHVQAGPTCTMYLGDLGAEVVKVEAFGGDQFRDLMDGAHFVNFNRNKRGIALDLKQPEGKEILLKMAKGADVFVENFAPGTVEKLGFGYEVLNRLNPRIVYCSISGFGQDGPYKDYPAYDPVVQAMSGIMETTGNPDRPPVRIRPALVDYASAVNAALGIVSALFQRQATGKGQRVDVALLDVAINPMSPYFTDYKRTGKLPKRAGSCQPFSTVNQALETRDGFVYVAAGPNNLFENLCRALKLDHLVRMEEFADRDGRNKHREELSEILCAETRKYGTKEMEEKLLAAGVPCSRIRNVDELVDDRHLRFREMIEETDHPVMGKIITVKTPLFFSGRNVRTRRRAPLLGEHTAEVLAELGYGKEEIRDLLRRKIALRGQS